MKTIKQIKDAHKFSFKASPSYIEGTKQNWYTWIRAYVRFMLAELFN